MQHLLLGHTLKEEKMGVLFEHLNSLLFPLFLLVILSGVEVSGT